MECVANTLFLTLEQVFRRLKSLSVYRSTLRLTGKFLHEHFVPAQEVVSQLQQGRITTAKCACKVFSTE